MARQRQKYLFWVNNGRSNNVWQTLYSNFLQEFVTLCRKEDQLIALVTDGAWDVGVPASV